MSETLKLSTLAAAIIVGCSVSIAPMASAQDGPGRGGPVFEELDANGDGSITEAEMQDHRMARFAAMDSDGNGSLSAAEMTAAAEQRKAKRAERMIERMDANDDGEVSQEELAALGEGRRGGGFSRLDADGDGSVTKAEFDAAKDKRRAFFQKHRHQNDG